MRTALVAICAQFEEPYLHEWIDWHLDVVGFSKICLYLNDWTKDYDNYRKDKVDIVKFDGEQMQLPAYNHFTNNHINDYDWAGYWDIDEFLYLGKHSLESWLSQPKFKTTVGIGINERLFGDSGIKDDGNRLVTTRFVHRQSGFDRHIKMMINYDFVRANNWLQLAYFANPHCISIGCQMPIVMSADGAKYIIGPYNYDYNSEDDPWLAHYFCKTREEYTYRRSFGRADWPRHNPDGSKIPGAFRNPKEFDEYNFNDVFDDRLAQV